MSADCECPCFGCAIGCQQDPPQWGAEAHRCRIRMALERSLLAELASRGSVCSCDGDDSHRVDCPMGLLVDRISDFVVHFSTVLEDPFGPPVATGCPPTTASHSWRAREAFAVMVAAIELATAGRPRVS